MLLSKNLARAAVRWLSTGIGGISDGGTPVVFNRAVKRIQRDAAALRPDWREHGILREEVAERLVDRLDDTLRKFPIAADLGCADGTILSALRGRGGIKELHQCDSSQIMLDLCKEGDVGGVMATKKLVDEEGLDFAEASLDLVISNLTLHWINDVPETLSKIRKSLKPDGLFLASILGGDTLSELRYAFAVAEMERDGGVSPHVSPLAGISDAGNLLGRAGFALPAVDTDMVTIKFPSAIDVMLALQGMGENNAINARRPYISRETMLAAAAVYESEFGDKEGGVPATFQIIYLSGWAPHASQQQAKERGSATLRLGDIGSVQTLEDDPALARRAAAPPRGLDLSREQRKED